MGRCFSLSCVGKRARGGRAHSEGLDAPLVDPLPEVIVSLEVESGRPDERATREVGERDQVERDHRQLAAVVEVGRHATKRKTAEGGKRPPLSLATLSLSLSLSRDSLSLSRLSLSLSLATLSLSLATLSLSLATLSLSRAPRRKDEREEGDTHTHTHTLPRVD